MESLQGRAPLREWSAEQIVAAVAQAVEQHQLRRSLSRQLRDPALCGMEPRLQRIERQYVADRHDQLAVEDEPRLIDPGDQRYDLGKVAGERLARLRQKLNRTAVAEHQ